MGVVCNDRCLCSDIIIIYLPELFAFSASRFRQTIQAGILYYNTPAPVPCLVKVLIVHSANSKGRDQFRSIMGLYVNFNYCRTVVIVFSNILF